MSKQRVSQLINRQEHSPKASKAVAARQLYLPADPVRAAEKIHATFGNEFAQALKGAGMGERWAAGRGGSHPAPVDQP